LLHRLSVFAGGWALAAAEEVCAEDGIERWEVLDLLTSLVDKSLVLYEDREGEGRYNLLETVRQYAREKLQESSEEESTQERHLSYFLALAEEVWEKRYSTEAPMMMDRLEREHDNCRTALDFCAVSAAAQTHLRLVGAIWWFWLIRG